MKMQKRTNLVTQFSSFLYVKEESSSLITYWKITPELQRNMELLLKQQIICAEEDKIAQEFLQWLKNNQDQLKYKHLIAYLQESCFFASKKVYQRLQNYWDLFTWLDYFQWANLLVSSPVQLLSKYDGNFKFKLTTYATNKIECQLIDQAYKYMGWERASDWGLLRQLNVSNRRKCLEKIGGLKGSNLQKYLLIWECFNLIYQPRVMSKNKQLQCPSSSHYTQISNEYNFLITKQGNIFSSINSDDCEAILLSCIDFARQYCNPRTIISDKYLDNLSEDMSLDFQEEKDYQQTQWDLVNNILTTTFSQLTMAQKILFYLWKGIEITQIEIVLVMSKNYPNFVTQQYQLAREIKLVRKILLESLIEKILVEQKVKLTKAKITDFKTPLDSWLQQHCKQFLSTKISCIYESLSMEEKENIKQYLINKNWSFNTKIDNQFCLKIANLFQENIQLEFNLIFPETEHIKVSFIHLIEEWMTNYTHLLINNS